MSQRKVHYPEVLPRLAQVAYSSHLLDPMLNLDCSVFASEYDPYLASEVSMPWLPGCQADLRQTVHDDIQIVTVKLNLWPKFRTPFWPTPKVVAVGIWRGNFVYEAASYQQQIEPQGCGGNEPLSVRTNGL